MLVQPATTATTAALPARKVSGSWLWLIVAITLLATVIFFSPRLWLMRHYVPGSFQWDRAHTYLLQCAEPFRRDIEPAMLWRLLPSLVCHALHLPGLTPLVVPWLGIIAATAYVAILLRRERDDFCFVLGGTLLFATTSAVLVPLGWLGMNDAWVWLGLLAVAFGRGRWVIPIACCLCPWVDERFVIGFPLAWAVRRAHAGTPWHWRHAMEALWLVPYAGLRLWLGRHDAVAAAATSQFLRSSVAQAAVLVPLAPLGWWMGLRAGWLAVGYGCGTDAISRWRLAMIATLTLLVLLLVASDISRSVAILIPLMVLGCLRFSQRHPLQASRALLTLGVINLLIPAAHVSYTKIDPISPLPVEVLRLLRIA